MKKREIKERRGRRRKWTWKRKETREKDKEERQERGLIAAKEESKRRECMSMETGLIWGREK